MEGGAPCAPQVPQVKSESVGHPTVENSEYNCEKPPRTISDGDIVLVEAPIAEEECEGSEESAQLVAAKSAAEQKREEDAKHLHHNISALTDQISTLEKELELLSLERPPDIVKIHELRMSLVAYQKEETSLRKELADLVPDRNSISTNSSSTTMFSENSVEASEPTSTQMCGYLSKEGHIVKNWRSRWFVLQGSFLVYYVSEAVRQQKGLIRLTEDVIIEVLDTQNGFQISGGPNKPYKIVAPSDEVRNRWVRALRQRIAELGSSSKSPSSSSMSRSSSENSGLGN